VIFFGTFIEGEVGSLTWALLIGGLEYLFAQSLEAVAEGVRSAEVGYLLVVAGLFVIYFPQQQEQAKNLQTGQWKATSLFPEGGRGLPLHPSVEYRQTLPRIFR